MRSLILMSAFCVSLAVAQEGPVGEEGVDTAEKPAESTPGVKQMSGMSILGNEEAPKALVIVPWKSSKLGDGLGISDSLDETPRPVDKEVFMRELHFYDLRSGNGG